MPPSSQSFTALNSPCDPTLPESMDYFTLQAPPNTDLWRKPPAHDTCTSPILYTRLSHPFVAAEVTVSADWEMEWDQGGLVIFGGRPPGTPTLLPQPRPSTAPAPASVSEVGHAPNAPPPPYIRPPPASKWVKAGLEFCNGHPHASSVSATTDGADWAMSPLPLPPSPSSPSTSSTISPTPYPPPQFSSLRIKLERIGYALWIWFSTTDNHSPNDHDDPHLHQHHPPSSPQNGDGAENWRKLREVTWFFWGVEDKCVRVGVYASRPANFGLSQWASVHAGDGEGGRGLEVEFEGLEIF